MGLKGSTPMIHKDGVGRESLYPKINKTQGKLPYLDLLEDLWRIFKIPCKKKSE